MRLKLGLFIILAIFSTTMVISGAVNYGDMGEVYYTLSDTIAPGLEYKTLHAENQRGFVFEYTPQMGTVPVVVNGDYVYGRSTLGNMITNYVNTGNANVSAGINADFFSMQTGVPLGVLINDGRLFASCEGKNAFGLYSDGTAVIGEPQTNITMKIGDIEDTVEYFNKYPTVYNIYILNSDFDETTRSTEPSLEIVVKLARDTVFTQWCDISGVVTDIHRDSNNNTIEEGYCIVSIANDSKFYKRYKDVRIGDEVTITIRCDEEWRDVVTAVGGGDIILENSMMPDGIVDEEHESLSNPRTAVGITREGKIIFFAIDGRRTGHSRGLKLDELASTMRSLGCVRALNLDGGGSTTVIVKNQITGEYELMNRPTDGTQRRISSSIVFVNLIESDGEPDHIKITPNSPQVLSKGGKVQLGINIFDSAYNIIDMDEESYIYEYELHGDIGYMENDIFIAEAESGSATLTAYVNVSGNVMKTSTQITIVPTLTDFEITPETEQIEFGGTVQLDIKGYRLTYETYVTPERFTFECDTGTVDSDGVFHHDGVSRDETVTIAVKYGKKTQYINLDVLNIMMPFVDTENHWSEIYINQAYKNNWIVDEMIDEEKNIYPDQKITRSEFAAMLALFLELEINPLGDGETWDIPYINAVIESGLMRGKSYPDGTVDFSGGDYITRAEIMYVFTDILADYGDIEPLELDFADIDTVPEWAANHINLAISAGLVKGYEDNTLRPLNEVTRAETAVMFIRLKEYKIL